MPDPTGSAPADQASPGAAPASAATEDDHRLMALAIEQARQGAATPGASAIGCVLAHGNQVLVARHNEVGLRHDPTAHAEMVAIRAACAALQEDDLRGVTLYSTLQPCGMCTMASIWAHIGRIVYGAGRDDVHPMYFEARHLDTMNFIGDTYADQVTVIAGVMRDECAALYYGPGDTPPPEEVANA